MHEMTEVRPAKEGRLRQDAETPREDNATVQKEVHVVESSASFSYTKKKSTNIDISDEINMEDVPRQS